MDSRILLIGKDINSNDGVPDGLAWKYNMFHGQVMSSEFPCGFGINAERMGTWVSLYWPGKQHLASALHRRRKISLPYGDTGNRPLAKVTG